MRKLLLACVVLLGFASAASAQTSRKTKSPAPFSAKTATPAEIKAHDALIVERKKAVAAAKKNPNNFVAAKIGSAKKPAKNN